MALSEERALRYARQLALPEIGREGQEKLLSSKVLIIGAGGLGSPAALYLAAAGVGTIGVADGDTVEASNLQRQILHGNADLGRRKTESAAEALRELDPEIRVVLYPTQVTEESLPALLAGYDFVLDCTDDFETKLRISDACVRAGKPFCHAAVSGFFGQLLTYVPEQGPCCRCAFHGTPAGGAAREAGVLGAAAGAIGCLQAAEAIKVLLGAGEPLTGRLLNCDLLRMEFQTIPLRRDPACPVCGQSQ